MAKPTITQEYVRSLLRYDSETGIFTWNARPRELFVSFRGFKIWNARYAGQRAGASMTNGYRLVRVDRRCIYEHRLVWLWVHGRWPSGVIDHIDHDGANNVLANLREASVRQNQANQRLAKISSSGFKGVSFHAGKWSAQIGARDTHRYLGRFETKEEAALAYDKAAQDQYGDFANFNFPGADQR